MKNYLYFLLSFIAASFYSLQAQHVDQQEFLESRNLKTHEANIDNVNFYFHYLENQKEFLNKSLDVAMQNFPRIHKYFDYKPMGDVHIIISDSAVFANGFASVFPRNTIVLNNYPPTGQGLLSFSNDWIGQLVIHEYIHVVTLEMTEGVLGIARYFLGSTAKLAGVIPSWLSEGIATWGESYFTKEGRLRNPSARLMLAEMANDPNACHKIECLDHFNVNPYGHSPYIIGSYFLNSLELKKKGTLSCLFKKNGRSLPFFMNQAFNKCAGASAQSLLDKFWSELKEITPNFRCEVLDLEHCEKILSIMDKKYLYQWIWSAGVLSQDDWVITVVNPSVDSRRQSQLQKQLYIFNLKTGKSSIYKNEYPVDKIYWANREKKLLGITFIQNYASGSQRKNRIYKIDSRGKLKQLSEADGAEYRLQKKNEWLDIAYAHSHWNINNKNVGEPLAKINQKDITNNKISFNPISKVSHHPIQNSNYNGLKHLNLNYLLLLYSYSGELPFFSVSTTLSDPYLKHQLSLALDFYQDVSDVTPVTGSALYRYQFLNNFYAGVGFQGRLSRAVGAVETNESKTFSFSVSKKFLKKYFSQQLALNIYQVNENDFLASIERRTKKLSLSWDLTYSSLKIAAFLRSWSLGLGLNFSQVSDFDSSYSGFDISTTLNFTLSPWWGISIFAHYGEYFKDSLDDGALYLGGANSTITGQYAYPSYAISFQNGFGNKILSSKLENTIEIGRPGWGSGLFPVFLNSVSLIGGAEYFLADVLYDGINIKRDSSAYSYFAGFKMDFTVAYNFPVNIKLIYSQINDHILEDSQLLLLIDAPLIP